MTKKRHDFKFENNRLWCRCSNGRCPNYKVSECGAGGKKTNKKYGHDFVLNELKKSFKVDHTFGREHHSNINRIWREKKNGK